ncbi:MAG: hypothetical protein ACOYXT_07540 [Bacteroidota bacterium]
MQLNDQLDNKPKGKVKRYEDYYLTERKGQWVPNEFAGKTTCEFDANDLITCKKDIHASSGIIESETLYKYNDKILVQEALKSKWGESIKNYYCNQHSKLIKTEIINSSNDSFNTLYEYDDQDILIKSVTEFNGRKDIYEYRHSKQGELLVVETLINGIRHNTEYKNDQNKIIKRINRDNEVIEYFFNSDGILLAEIRGDYTREFEYNNDGLPIKFIGYSKSENNSDDFTIEYYDFMVDLYDNWVEVKCYTENSYFSKHLKTIRKRIINYF